MNSSSKNYFIDLQQWQLIRVSGPDANAYLQGQFTINMNKLTNHHFSFAAHCDAKGKVLSNMLVFQQQNHLFYIQRQSITDIQVSDLKKYAVFSNVNINKDNSALLGICGKNAATALNQLGLTLPSQDSNIHSDYDITIIQLNKPTTRFIAIAPTEKIICLKAQLIACQFTHGSDSHWVIQEIKAGYPIIDQANLLQFLPQAIGLDNIAAISFDKGCYRGQEMVARATYRGANKRALFCLIGQSGVIPTAGEALEIAIGNNWRDTGRILIAEKLADNRVIIQAVLNKDVSKDEKFRIKGDNTSAFSIAE